MDPAVTQGSELTSTPSKPQRKITAVGSPQAAVDWALTTRFDNPARSSGRRTTISAQLGSLLWSAGSSDTVAEQPARKSVATKARAAGRFLVIAFKATFDFVSEETIGSLGEIESLRRCVARLRGGNHTLVGSGDDAALIRSENSFLVSTDTLIEDHDFRLNWSSAFDLGFKSVATNFADIAAMGGEPTALVVALVVPKQTKVSWLENFADGLQEAINQLAPNAEVVGGDLAAGDKVVIAVTAHGTLNGLNPVKRSGARVGDLVTVCGTLGRAACGLAILESNRGDLIRSYDEWVSVQLRPTPPISQGVIANRAGATSMLDVSDGLARDSYRIALASGVAIDLDSNLLKGFEATLEQPAQALGVDPAGWVLTGGEDHALLATFPSAESVPVGFKPIGIVREGSGVLLDGAQLAALGWDSIQGS